MKKTILLAAAGLTAFSALGTSLEAAPTVSRLTPPSALFSFGDANPPVIARFLPGQRFDLQCTVSPEPTKTITAVTFQVNNVNVAAPVTLTTTGLVATLPAGSTVATVRAYSLLTPGVHTFKATATQSDGTTTVATGNFEIVRIPGAGSLKNVIIMIGDGMGAPHRTAARIMSKGVQMGKVNEPLHMDTFPYTGLVQTASLNSIITDSSPGAACYSTGNKSNNNQQGVFPDDTLDVFDNPRVELIGEFLARKRNKALGIVTTSDVFDATPGSFGSHTSNRGAGTGICDQYLDEMATTANLRVLLGGGRKWFLPRNIPGNGSARATASDYVLPTDLVTRWGLPTGGSLNQDRDLIGDFVGAGFTYAPDATTLASSAASATKLLGLFALSNMNVAKDKIDNRRTPSPGSVVSTFGFPDQPMLDEMTSAALTVLNKNASGFVLMVEGASIDKQAHNMDTERWILDTIEFDRAVGVAKAFAQANKNTLVIVTADHECAGATIIGASTQTNATHVSRLGTGAGTDANGNGALNPGDVPGLRLDFVGTYDSAGFPTYTNALDGYPVTTDIDKKMLVGYGANADRNEDWLTNANPLVDSQQPAIVNQSASPAGAVARDSGTGFFITGQVSDAVAAHTASDIPLSAFGKGAQNFSGTFDNTEVFFRILSLTGVR